MRTLTYTAPGSLEFKEVQRPTPAAGMALVRVHQAGICGTDMAIIHGAHPRARPPLVPGHEYSGEIVEFAPGPHPGSLAVGDKVALFPLISCGKCKVCRQGFPHVCRNLRLTGIDSDGGFADYAAVLAERLVKLPDDLDYRQGALLEPMAVGIHAVEMAAADPRDITVVIGAGPIGLLTAHSLRHAGFAGVLVSDLNIKRLERAKLLGFDAVPSGELTERVAGTSGGEGADLVLECAGAAPAVQTALDLLRPRGRLVMVSVHKRHPEVDLRTLNFKEITMVGARVYTRRNFDTALDALRGLDAGRIISHTFNIRDGAKALALSEDPNADTCKVLISMED